MSFLRLIACCIALSATALAACSADAESDEPPRPPSTDVPAAKGASDVDRARSTGDSFANPLSVTQPATFSCRAGAFCDDFESPDWATQWTDVDAIGGAHCERGNISASRGVGSLHCTAPNEGSAAFALHSLGDVGTSWHGSLAFALRIDAVPTTGLSGPELEVKTEDGPVTLRLVIGPSGMSLEQHGTSACRGARCVDSVTPIAVLPPGRWMSVTIGLEVNAADGGSYGRLETIVNGGDVHATNLSVPIYGGSAYFRAGITGGDSRVASADFDDVSLFVAR